MRRVWSLVGVILAACGTEGALRVSIEGPLPGDRVCLLAAQDGALQFAAAYDVATLPAGERTLTFVRGAEGGDALTVWARLTREGAVTGSDATFATLPTSGTLEQRLTPGRCMIGTPAGTGPRPAGTLAGTSLRVPGSVPAPPQAFALDIDGDARDELLAVSTTGRLVALDLEARESGSRVVTELVAPGAWLAGGGDLDGDCRLDVVASVAAGPLVVLGDAGRSRPPLDTPSPAAIALGVRSNEGTAGLVVASARGLSVISWDGTGTALDLAPGAAHTVRVGDLDGDGEVDVLAAGPDGTRVFVSRGSAWSAASELLPDRMRADSGPAALGNVDADARIDVATVEGASVQLATRGDGGAYVLVGSIDAGDAIRALEAVDLDGDCKDELVLSRVDGVVEILGADGTGLTRRWSIDALVDGTADVVAVDAEGDGVRELALVSTTGAVRLWRP